MAEEYDVLLLLWLKLISSLFSIGKKVSQRALKMASGIQFAKEKVNGWEANKAVQRIWVWFSKISKAFYSCSFLSLKLKPPETARHRKTPGSVSCGRIRPKYHTLCCLLHVMPVVLWCEFFGLIQCPALTRIYLSTCRSTARLNNGRCVKRRKEV